MSYMSTRTVSRLPAAAFLNHWIAVRSLPLLALLVLLAAPAAAKSEAAARPAPQTSVQADGYTLKGRVVRVADGDTFTLLVAGRAERVRMASIDAPETGNGRERPGQPWAQASRKALAALIAGKTLELACFERDRYERNVCDAPLGDGSTANQKQVAAGMAWANMEGRGKFMRDPGLPELERRARQAGLGLWQAREPVAPWVWRYRCWKQAQC